MLDKCETQKISIPVSFSKALNNYENNNIEHIIKISSTETLFFLNLNNKILEISVYVTNNKEIKEINRVHRKIDKPTNVLSFQYNKIKKSNREKQYPGEIIISIEKIHEESKLQGIQLEHHLAHMTIHGVLHIFGYNHIKEQEAQIMESKEQQILYKIEKKVSKYQIFKHQNERP